MPPSIPSSSAQRRVRLSQRILSGGEPSDSPCDYCLSAGKACVRIMGDKRLKCSECARRGRPCVDMSWESVDRSVRLSREDLSRDESRRDELMRELAALMARIDRKRKVVELAQKRSIEQAHCLAREMAAEGEDVYQTVIDASLLNAQLDDPFAQSGDSFDGTLLAVPDTM